MFIKEAGKRLATPLFTVLVVIETSDVIFAIDSIPAILAVSREQFILFSSNAFAILGLRALYFLLADLRDKFDYLQTGLAVILAFVGFKMIISEWYHIPTFISLRVIAVVLTVSIIASIKLDRPGDHEEVLDEHYGEGLKKLFEDEDHDGVVDDAEDERRAATELESALEDEAAVVAEELRDVGGGLGLAAAVEGRLRVVLDAELEHLAEVVAADLAGEGEGHVDAGAHAGGGDDLAVDHDALVGGDGAVAGQVVEGEPVGGGALALEQAGGAEHERAGAHRRRPRGGLVGGAQPVEDRLVLLGLAPDPGPPGTRRMSGRGRSASVASATRASALVSVRFGPASVATKVRLASGRRESTS